MTCSLAEAQAAMARTLALGPDACPPGLFAGNAAAVLRGLLVHANTISHARLVALEDTFPIARAHLGEAAFNAASRAWLDAGHGAERSLDRLGEGFPAWLAAADPLAESIAGFEWAWLESYHAAEAEAVSAADLAGLDGEALGALRLRAHPAAALLPASDALAEALGLEGEGQWLFLARPDAEVRAGRCDSGPARLLTWLAGQPLAAALDDFLADPAVGEPFAALQFLLDAGMLTWGKNRCSS